MDPSVSFLRNYLLESLQKLPGTREFHIHVLVSAPRKHTGLFPYAHPRPRVYLQDILILLSEQEKPGAPRVFVTALEVNVYNAPSTSCGIVYISKVDSTGQGIAPSPTYTLVKAFLTYYADPATRPFHADTVWLQLFARAQNQYLFPNSAEYSGKRPLTDVKLCAWWKRIFSQVGEEVARRTEGAKLGLYYVLPGLTELEATHTLQFASSVIPVPGPAIADPIPWRYGHQYSQTELPLPCPPSKATPNLGHFIPSFDDDPKSRFIDEIAFTTEEVGVRSPERKRSRTFGEKDEDAGKPASVASKEVTKEYKVQGELGSVSADDFWERMSFRQECIAGAVTGFFTLGIHVPPPPADSHPASAPSPLAPQPGQVPPSLVRRVVASLLNGHEFSTAERAVRATETLEGAIQGLCENIATRPPDSSASSSAAGSSATLSAPLLLGVDRERTPEPPSASALLDVPRTPPRKRKGGAPLPPEVSPNPFPEPVASLDTYLSHIYGSIIVKNPAQPPKEPPDVTSAAGDTETAPEMAPQAVNVLAVRKKKRKAEA
ncbi:histone acetylation protein-domain-containing protein [Cytidiella melzeri]|nr:histone acetylation protein-domain-containing protein [Cytidiella melzeri]